MHAGDVPHGGIGMIDMEKVLMANDISPVFFPGHYDFSLIGKCKRMMFLLRKMITFSTGHYVCVFKMPINAKVVKLLIRWLSTRKNIRLICYISDIDGIRDASDSLLQKELMFYKKFRYFIVHNSRMEEYLKQHIPAAKFSSIQLFDFLATPVTIKRHKSLEIAFAGNLFKSLFLEKTDKELKSSSVVLHIYGMNVTEAMLTQRSNCFHGVVGPYELPAAMKGAFGLVWDGDSGLGPKGAFGDYMRLIAHHKTSLYLMAGMPVIVYEDAGTAEIIVNEGAGFTISKLSEIEGKINCLTDDAYDQMCTNAQRLAMKLSKGEFLQEALSKLL